MDEPFIHLYYYCSFEATMGKVSRTAAGEASWGWSHNHLNKKNTTYASKSDVGASAICYLCKFNLITWKIGKSSKGSFWYFSGYSTNYLYLLHRVYSKLLWGICVWPSPYSPTRSSLSSQSTWIGQRLPTIPKLLALIIQERGLISLNIYLFCSYLTIEIYGVFKFL